MPKRKGSARTGAANAARRCQPRSAPPAHEEPVLAMVPAIEPPSPRRSLALVRRRPPRAPQSPRRGAPRAGAFRQSSALPRAVPKGEQRGRDELAVPEGVQHPRWVPAGPQVVHARGAFAFSRAPSPVVCVPRPEKGRPESAPARARVEFAPRFGPTTLGSLDATVD